MVRDMTYDSFFTICFDCTRDERTLIFRSLPTVSFGISFIICIHTIFYNSHIIFFVCSTQTYLLLFRPEPQAPLQKDSPISNII